MKYNGPNSVLRRIETKSQFLLFLLPFCLSLDAQAAPQTVRAQYLMGTVCEISSDGANPVTTEAFEEIARVESMLSTWKPQSELARLNQSPVGQPAELSEELFALLSRALSWSVRTGGTFNPLVGRLVDVWGLRTGGAVPDAATLSAARDSARLDQVTLNAGRHTIQRHTDTWFEEGAFGKGYALDRAIALLRHRGVSQATINFGGQLAFFGQTSSLIEIASPEDRTQPIVRLRFPAGSVSTSGGSEKTFSARGRSFIHIVDPRSGEALPPRGSVTVFSPGAFDADVLSTALFVLGPDEGIPWAEANGVAVLYLLPDRRGSITFRASSTLRKLSAIEPLSKKLKLED